MSDLPFTGERFIPGAKGEIWVEHWHRYHFARRWVAGKRVLDVACGEGYGSALLARDATHVTGVDISQTAVDHARATYANLANAEFACSSCTQLPLADASIDVAVSFETIEHITEQEQFANELARVLKPDGVLILSCPNKLEYSDRRNFANEFHVKELYREELAQLISARWPESHWYGQRPTFFSLIAPEQAEVLPLASGRGLAELPPLPSGRGSISAQLIEVSESAPAESQTQLSSPLYFVVVASRSRAALDATAPALSVLSDRDDWVHKDYEKVMRWMEDSVRRSEELEKQLALRDHDVARIAAEVTRLTGEVNLLQQSIALQDGALSAQQALADATAVVHLAELALRDTELARRRSWRWWLKLPMLRMGLLK